MLTRSLEKAKDAFLKRDAAASAAAHGVGAKPPAAAEKHTQAQGRYIKSVVYGGLDGIITGTHVGALACEAGSAMRALAHSPSRRVHASAVAMKIERAVSAEQLLQRHGGRVQPWLGAG